MSPESTAVRTLPPFPFLRQTTGQRAHFTDQERGRLGAGGQETKLKLLANNWQSKVVLTQSVSSSTLVPSPPLPRPKS